MTIYGHAKNIYSYKKEQPQVALFTGPKSVGKMTVAKYLAYDQATAEDTWIIPKLTAEVAREVVTSAEHLPMGDKKVFVVNIDYARQTDLNTLLKILETPLNGQVKFIFVSSVSQPPATLISRSRSYFFSYLSKEALTKILVEKFKKKTEAAQNLAALASGTVQGALDAEILLAAKPTVMAVLNALNVRNTALLFRQENEWKEQHTNLLRIWCTEVITQNWKYFSEDDVLSLDKGFPIAILRSLHLDVRPKLVIHSVLNDLIRS